MKAAKLYYNCVAVVEVAVVAILMRALVLVLVVVMVVGGGGTHSPPPVSSEGPELPRVYEGRQSRYNSCYVCIYLSIYLLYPCIV